jgi:enoyl-CoA hydratase/carnithine racemase
VYLADPILFGRPPVNSLNRALIEDLTKSLVAASQNADAKAVVLTSGKFGIFSAGLDINELIITGQRDVEAEDRLFAFWTTLQDMWLQLLAPCPSLRRF